MKTIISLLAVSLFAAPAFADIVVEIKSVELLETKANGKSWDLKIPLKKGSQLPDIEVEVVENSKSVFKTPVQKNTNSSSFTAQKFQVTEGSSVIFKVWDKDPAGHDIAAEIPHSFKGQSGDIKLSGGQVKSLVIHVPAPAAPAPKAEAAPAPKAEAAPAPKAEAAPAPKAEAAPAPKAEEAPAAK